MSFIFTNFELVIGNCGFTGSVNFWGHNKTMVACEDLRISTDAVSRKETFATEQGKEKFDGFV